MTIRQTLVEEFVTWAAAIPAEQNITQHPEFHARRRALSDAEIKAAIYALRSTAEAKFAEARELESEGEQFSKHFLTNAAANDLDPTVVHLRAPRFQLSEKTMREVAQRVRIALDVAVTGECAELREQMEAVCRAAFMWVRIALAKDEGVHISAIGEDAVAAAFSFLGATVMHDPEPPRAA